MCSIFKLFKDSSDSEEYSREMREASPSHLLATIESFPELLKHGIKMLESIEFDGGDYKWKVIMNLDRGKQISVKLSMVGTSSLPTGWEVNAIFNFFLYNHISDKYTCFRGKPRRIHAIDSEWGFSKLMRIKHLKDPSNGYLLKDKFVFGAEVFVIKNQPLVEKTSVLGISYPYKRQWKIPEFSKLESTWKSEEFSAGGYKWEILMYPNGCRSASGRYVSIFFRCVDAESFPHGKKVNASYLFTFKNKIKYLYDHSKKAMDCFSSTAPSWGFTDFKAIGDMRDPSRGFVVDDCCNLEIQLSVIDLRTSIIAIK